MADSLKMLELTAQAPKHKGAGMQRLGAAQTVAADLVGCAGGGLCPARSAGHAERRLPLPG